MAFTLEDGTGIIGANAYVSAAEVDAYFADRGDAVWAAVPDTLTKQAYIIQVTDYIETRFSQQFMGIREFPTVPQGLSFPRSLLYDREGYLVTGIPLNLKKAVYEYCLILASGESLFLVPSENTDGSNLIKKKEVIGPIEISTEFSGTGSPDAIKSFPQADFLLQPFLNSSVGNRRVIRG